MLNEWMVSWLLYISCKKKVHLPLKFYDAEIKIENINIFPKA